MVDWVVETIGMKRFTQFKRGTCYAVAVVIVAMVFILPVITKLFSTHDLFFQMCAAVLGVVLSAVITFILLMAQSNKELQQERAAKVYEHKLAVCKDFLEHLRMVLEDGTVTPEEANTLKFAFANIAVHIGNQLNLVRISSYLQKIVEECGPGTDKLEVEGIVVQNTLKIVSVFREEIYGTPSDDVNKKELAELIEKLKKKENTQAKEMKPIDYICANLSVMLGNTSSPVSSEKETDGTQKAEESPRLKILQAVRAKLSATLDPELWMVSCPDALEITCLKKDMDTKDRFIIRLTREDKHYFQCHLAFPDDDARRAFYLPMRAKLGGGFNKYCWWCYVDGQVESILSSEVASTEDIAYAVDTCFRELKDVVDYITAVFTTEDEKR